jgi:formiminotetrahydrofolate cyclodeaminase
MAESRFREDTIGRFLGRLASEEPTPGGGAAAAIAAAMAAALVGMAARFSKGHIDAAPSLIDTADRLRDEAVGLADDDAVAYTDVLSAYAAPEEVDPEGRRRRIVAALERASDVPLEIARVAVEAAALGTLLCSEGNPNLEGDATAAVQLARAAACSAGRLVELNVRLGKLGDDRLERLGRYLDTISDSSG